MKRCVLTLLLAGAGFAVPAWCQSRVNADQQPKYATSTAGFVLLVSPGGMALEINWQAQPPVLRAKPQGTVPEMFDSAESNGTWSMPQGCALLVVFRGLIQKQGLDYSIGRRVGR